MLSMLSSSHLRQIFSVLVNVDNSALHVTNSFTFLTWDALKSSHLSNALTDLFICSLKNCATTCVKCRSTLGLHFSGEGVFVRRLALYIIHLKVWQHFVGRCCCNQTVSHFCTMFWVAWHLLDHADMHILGVAVAGALEAVPQQHGGHNCHNHKLDYDAHFDFYNKGVKLLMWKLEEFIDLNKAR